ncbi:MAG: histidine--tRNA ligase [Elusimicrobiota bacterium]
MAEPQHQPVRGFRDVLPPESERAAALEAVARHVFALYGFSEVRLPTLEPRELFIKATGETTDIVEKEMFQLEDAGGRSLALRPEGTPGVVRAFLNRHLSQQGGVTKLFYIGSMFRAERPQKGRYREFGQIGVEVLGNPHPAADVEAILAHKAILDQAGLEGRTKLRLGNLGCDASRDCRPLFRERLRGFLAERAAELCDSCRRRVERNPLRALDCKEDGPKLAQDAPALEPCPECLRHVDQVSALLTHAGCEHVYPDKNLVRGLDYYTRTVFEFSAEGLGTQDAVSGGGRYDALVAAMGGPDTPAVGWALGVERVLMAADAAEPGAGALNAALPSRRADVFLALQSREDRAVAEGVRLLDSIRRFGIRAGCGVFTSSLKAQMREAGRQGARLAVIIGDAELEKDPPTCILKDMGRGEQVEVGLSELIETVGAKLIVDKAQD